MARRVPITGFTYEGHGPRADGPPPIPPPPPRRALPKELRLTVAEAVNRMVGEYRLRTGGEHSSSLARDLRSGKAVFSMNEVACRVLEAGIDPAYLVEFVVLRFTQKQGGRSPRHTQVFSPRFIDSWIDEYRRCGAATLGHTPTAHVPPERLALWRARYSGAQPNAQVQLQARTRDGSGGGAPDDRGSRGAAEDPPEPQG